jgi:hypothetical protein
MTASRSGAVNGHGVDPPRPISVTFIPATVFDNPILLQANPDYCAWLLSLPTLERERLLGGNWKIRPAAGLYFRISRPAMAPAFSSIRVGVRISTSTGESLKRAAAPGGR